MVASLLPLAAFLILTYTSATAAYRARDDPLELLFVISSYSLVVTLFLALRALERTPMEREKERKCLVAGIWAVSVVLNLSFTHRVAGILPPAMTVPLWCSAAGTTAFGFWLCFCTA